MSSCRRNFSLLLCCIAAGLAAACGGTGSPSLSPVAPSSNAPASSGIGATISGQVTGLSAAALSSSSLSTMGADTFHTMESRGVTVSIVGTGTSTTADGSGRFTLTNVPAGTVQLNFSAPGSSATVTISGIGPNDQVQIAVTFNGSRARVDSEHHSSPDNKGEFQGRITAIDAAARSFQVSGTTVKVPASVTIRHGSKTLQFGDLKVGDHVEVRGTKEGTTITATEVKVESEDDDDDDEDARAAELKGVVSTLGGTCPALTFMVQNTKVSTTNNTTYDHGSCVALKDALRVEVKGTKLADGSVVATKVSIDDKQETATTELQGVVSTLGGTCPALTFMVQNTKVSTTNNTTYEHGSCVALKNNRRVEIKGTKQTDGSVVATRIEIAD